MADSAAVSGENEGTQRQAVKDAVPIMLGVIPFGLTCGLMGITVGLTAFEIVLMSALVFAGAAQFAAILLFGTTAAGWGLIVFTTLVVNLRHILMSASLAPSMQQAPLLKRFLLSFSLTDESFALTTAYRIRVGYSAVYQLTVSILLYFVWVGSTALGVLFASQISDPLAWGLDFAMPAGFIVLLVQSIGNRKNRIIALIAAVASIAGALMLPGKWYIIIACLAACLAGLVIDKEKS
jgi:4-azaleucine resistance transporter AzlC